MANDSPKGSRRKQSLVAPVSIAAVVALIVLGAILFQRRDRPEPPPPAPSVEAPAAPPAAAIVPDPVLDRADLIKEANAIAAAYSAGVATPSKGKDRLVGRRFSIRIPFGCDGPQSRPGAAQAFYELDPAKRTVRLVARPAVWTSLPLIQELPAGAVESVEGFWIPHPWTKAEHCPPVRDVPQPATPAPSTAQTLGLAQLFDTGASRVRQRGEKPYEHVVKLGERDEGMPGAEGYRLVLEGVVAAYPDGRALRCWSETPDHRPICLYAVELDRVAFEAGGGGDLIAEWRD